MPATYFFSFRSPYSWLASLGLKTLIESGDKLDLVPFFEPDELSQTMLAEKGGEFHYRSMSDAKHRYILNDIHRLTRKFNIEHNWPVDSDPWWEPSHLGFIKANELGYAIPYFWQVYQCRWQQTLDISLPENIRLICLQANIPEHASEKIANAHDDKSTRTKGAEALYRIYREDIFGVPMFTVNRKQFWGIDRINDFLDEYGVQSPNDEVSFFPNPYALDFDHAGGCG